MVALGLNYRQVQLGWFLDRILAWFSLDWNYHGLHQAKPSIPHNCVKRLFREKIVTRSRESYMAGMGFYLFDKSQDGKLSDINEL